MKITFSNLGTIKKTELDLRPLTVIIGPNNTSKTYVAYSIYGLWQSLDGWRPAPQKLRAQTGRGHLSLRSNDSLTSIVNANLQEIADSFQKKLRAYFRDTSGKLFTDTHLVLHASREEIEEAARIPTTLYGGEVRVRGKKSAKGPLGKGPTADPLATELIWRTTSALFQRPFLLPVERNAFVITYKLLSDRRYKLLRDGQRQLFDDLSRGPDVLTVREPPIGGWGMLKEQEGVRYPKPIEDFLDFLTDVELDGAIEAIQDSPFQLLADDIDTKIHGNQKIHFKVNVLGGREIGINVKNDLTIDLYNASSSIKQLTPLLLYLRYRAKPGDFLIIDEPEMNLHPESQAKLLEVLGILVNLGVRVLLTTHSPYFMSHLNNLVAGDMTKPAILKKQAPSLYLKDHRAFLSMDQVGAYEMRNNELCSLKDEEYGIRWDTLSDVSSEIQGRFFEIHEKGRAGRGSDK